MREEGNFMPNSRRILLTAAAASLGCSTVLSSPRAQTATPGSVRLVTPFSEGGVADIAARRFARHAVRHRGAGALPLRVENMPGASGALGTAAVARAAPDGETLLLARVASSAILPATDPRTAYGLDDFTWLGLLDANPFVIAVPAGAPFADLPALLARLHDTVQPPLRFATSGPATILDLGIRKMFVLAGLPIDAAEAVATRGGGEALAAMLAGEADFLGGNLGDMMEAIRARRVRPLAIAGNARLPLLPQVPSTAEVGLPDMAHLSGWSAIAAPAGLPDELARQWEGVIQRVGADPRWVRETEAEGSRPIITDGAGARAHVLAQITLYRDIARRLGLG